MEPEVRFFFFCEGLITGGSAPPLIHNPFITITPPFMPTSFSFALALGLDQIDPRKSYSFAFRVFGPDEKMIGGENPFMVNASLTGAHDANKFTRPDGTVNAVANIELKNFPLSEQGYYRAEFLNKTSGKNKLLAEAKVYVTNPKGAPVL